MLETDATPTEVVNWFRSDQCRDELLLIWVSGERKHSQSLDELLLDTPAIDAVLQDRIAFLFTSASSKAAAIRAGGLTTAPFFRRLNRPAVGLGQGRVAKVARATMDAAGDFATFFELKETEVPALVVLIKHLSDHLVVPMGSEVALHKIRSWLSEVVASVRQHRERCGDLSSETTLRVDVPLQKVMDADRTLEAKRREIRDLLDGLLIRHPDAERLGKPLIDLITQEYEFEPAKARQAVTALLRKAEHEQSERLLRDGRVQKLDRKLSSLEVEEGQLRAALVRRRDIQDAHDLYRQSLEQLKKDLDRTSHRLAGSRMTSLSSSARGLMRAAPRVLDSSARILEALAKLSERLPRLQGEPGPR